MSRPPFPDPLAFTKSLPEEADALSAIALASKAHWGYPQSLLAVWADALTVSPAYIRAHAVRTIWLAERRVGFFAIRTDAPLLDHLWLLPEAIGRGFGARAFAEIEKECVSLGIAAFEIVSDPNAEGFYLGRGAERVGETVSVPQGRMLPRLRYRVRLA